jgi:hypothetical protein
MLEEDKICRVCQYLKPAAQFYKRRNGHRQSECRDCVIERNSKNIAVKYGDLEGSLDFKRCRQFLQRHVITPKLWEMTL